MAFLKIGYLLKPLGEANHKKSDHECGTSIAGRYKKMGPLARSVLLRRDSAIWSFHVAIPRINVESKVGVEIHP